MGYVETPAGIPFFGVAIQRLEWYISDAVQPNNYNEIPWK